jgi:mono/diheme cytochrome c family protein/DNA-binding beta-propeller fold protein YncE
MGKFYAVAVLAVLAGLSACTRGGAGSFVGGAEAPPALPDSAEMPPAPPPVPAPVSLERPSPAAREGGSVVLAVANGRTLALVSDRDADAVHVVDVEAGALVSSFPVRSPGPMVLLADGRLAVTSGERALVLLLRLHEDRRLREEGSWATGREASALALRPDDESLLVAAARDHELIAHDVKTGAQRHVAALLEPPSAIAFSPDGSHALVAHAAASDVLAIDLKTGASRKQSLDASGQDVEPAGIDVSDDKGKTWSFGNGMMTMHLASVRSELPVRARHAGAFAALASVAKRPERELVAHELMVPIADGPAVFSEEEAALAGYGGSANLSGSESLAISTLDRATGRRLSIERADGTCRLPRGAAYDEPRKRLLVACAGSRAVFAFVHSDNVTRAHTSMSDDTLKLKDAPPDIGYLTRTTPSFHVVSVMALPGPPDGLVLDVAGDRLIVSSLFGGTLAISRLSELGKTPAVVVRFTPSAGPSLSAEAARGRALFYRSNDARVASDGRACASCHVDGGSDGLQWKTTRGIRSTLVLKGRLERSGPFGWNGESPTLERHVAETIRTNLGGKGLPPADVADLVTFLRAMSADREVVAQEDGRIARGRAIFDSPGTACSSCHVAELATDEERHDVGSGGSFLTPSLVGLGRSAPYYHDGRYRSLDDLLARSDGKMGAVKGLSPDDRDALLAYLREL